MSLESANDSGRFNSMIIYICLLNIQIQAMGVNLFFYFTVSFIALLLVVSACLPCPPLLSPLLPSLSVSLLTFMQQLHWSNILTKITPEKMLECICKG